MTPFDAAWPLVKMPISYDQANDDFLNMGGGPPRYLYSGGHADDDFRYFTQDPNVALGIALFGSAVPRKYFPDEESRRMGSRNPTMRETVPRMRVIDTSMVGDDIELFGDPHEAVLPSREISQRLEEMGALTDIPQDRIEENLRQVIDSARFNKERYKKFRDTGVDEWGHEGDDGFENQKRFMRERMPFSMGWWEFDDKDQPDQLHPVFERLNMEWDPRSLENEMWWPVTSNTSAGFHGSPYSRKDLLNHVKGALNRLQTGVPGKVEIPDDQRKLFGIAENDDRPLSEGILQGWDVAKAPFHGTDSDSYKEIMREGMAPGSFAAGYKGEKGVPKHTTTTEKDAMRDAWSYAVNNVTQQDNPTSPVLLYIKPDHPDVDYRPDDRDRARRLFNLETLGDKGHLVSDDEIPIEALEEVWGGDEFDPQGDELDHEYYERQMKLLEGVL